VINLSSLSIQWTSLAEFFAMGGYGLYVWGSFGITGAAMVIEVIALRLSHKRLVQQLRT
jgi:heme exporter protein D